MSNLNKKMTIAITGACGTIGRALLNKQIAQGNNTIVAIDDDENALFSLQQTLGDNDINIKLADVRDLTSLEAALANVDVVFHVAALKHVGLGEVNAHSYIMTNIQGVSNIITAAVGGQVKKVLFTSSDKAVNPTNLMGATKLIGEKLISNAAFDYSKKCEFISTRFGNVIGSRGSVIDVFKKKLLKSEIIEVTDRSMSRFFMTPDKALDLLDLSINLKGNGQIVIPKMQAIQIIDLAHATIDVFNEKYKTSFNENSIKITNPRVGEKLYEELITHEETARAETSGDYIVVNPICNYQNSEQLELNQKAKNGNSRQYQLEVNSSETKFLNHNEIKELIKPFI